MDRLHRTVVMDEFGLIGTYLKPLARGCGPALGLGDDAAVLTPPQGHDLVFTKDMMIAGRHFFADDAPDLIARKLLRVNLSDLAAMGAAPLGYLLGLAFADHLDPDFTRRFTQGLRQDQTAFGIGLYGGDTVSGAGKLCLSLTAIGAVPSGLALKRSAARAGDHIWVSGTIGDAALGLRCLTGGSRREPHLIDRYYLPEPRLALGQALRSVAHGCADVSDGLLADLGHICDESGVGARLESARTPLSDAARRIIGDDRDLLAIALAGGDDYELVFTAPPEKDSLLAEIASRLAVRLTKIGVITDGAGVSLLDSDGGVWHIDRKGFQHD